MRVRLSIEAGPRRSARFDGRAVDQCERRRLADFKRKRVGFGDLRGDFELVAGGDAEEHLAVDIAADLGGAVDDKSGRRRAHVAAAEAGVDFLHLRARGGEARVGGDGGGAARFDGFGRERAGVADRFGALVFAARAHRGRLRFGDARLRGAGLRLREIGVEPRHRLAVAHVCRLRRPAFRRMRTPVAGAVT